MIHVDCGHPVLSINDEQVGRNIRLDRANSGREIERSRLIVAQICGGERARRRSQDLLNVLVETRVGPPEVALRNILETLPTPARDFTDERISPLLDEIGFAGDGPEQN